VVARGSERLLELQVVDEGVLALDQTVGGDDHDVDAVEPHRATDVVGAGEHGPELPVGRVHVDGEPGAVAALSRAFGLASDS
jgi:hypothetical protein